MNVLGVRAMGYEGVFERRFEDGIDKALLMGVRGVFVEGGSYLWLLADIYDRKPKKLYARERRGRGRSRSLQRLREPDHRGSEYPGHAV